jgi:hypothetical protein
MMTPLVLGALWPAACDCGTSLGMNGDGGGGADGRDAAGATVRGDECGNGLDDDGDGLIDEDCYLS